MCGVCVHDGRIWNVLVLLVVCGVVCCLMVCGVAGVVVVALCVVDVLDDVVLDGALSVDGLCCRLIMMSIGCAILSVVVCVCVLCACCVHD